MPEITVKELLEAGIHYGHRASRWNPKMKPYIYAKRKLIHILDIRETLRGLLTACKFLEKIASEGREVVFVGAKRQARKAVQAEAQRCGQHYVIERWIGGTLTNFNVIRSRVGRYDELELLEQSGELDKFSKKEGAMLRRELTKIRHNLEGIRRMNRLPGALVIVDPRREKIAVAEANLMGIPTVCLADTDCNPDVADILIPGNDDAMRAIEIVLKNLSDAVIAGAAARSAMAAPLTVIAQAPAGQAPTAPAPFQPQRPLQQGSAAPSAPVTRQRAPERVASNRRSGGGRPSDRRSSARPGAPRAPRAAESPKPAEEAFRLKLQAEAKPEKTEPKPEPKPETP